MNFEETDATEAALEESPADKKRPKTYDAEPLEDLDAEPNLEGTHDPSDEDATALPAWAAHEIPDDLKIPPERRIAVLRFRPEWTDHPSLGERTVVLWGITIAEERLAVKASQGDPASITDELAKRMVRAIDGKRVDWGTTGAQETARLWRELGIKCVDFIRRHYLLEHSLKSEQKMDFLANCCVVRSGVASPV